MIFPAGPDALDALDAAWIEDVLRDGGAFPSARVRRISTTRIGEDFGLEGTSVRVAIEGDGDLPRSLVVKWCGAAGGAREGRFYRETAPRLDLDLPRLHAACIDETADRAFLLMDDVSPATQGDVLVGATEEKSAALMRAMAALHAPFWNRPTDPAVAWLSEWAPDPAERVRLTNEALPRFFAEWSDRLPAPQRVAAESLPDRLPAAYAALSTAPRTLIHGDFHLDNVLFRPSGSPVVLDWPKVTRGAAVLDLATLLFKRGSADERLARRESWTSQYARALAARGVPDYGPTEIEAGVANAALVLFAGTVRWAARTYASERRPRVLALIEEGIRNGAAFTAESA